MSRFIAWRITLLVFWLSYATLLTLISISKPMGLTMVNAGNVHLYGLSMSACLVGILVAAVVLAGRLHRTQGGWGLGCFLLAPVIPLILVMLPEAKTENIGRPLAWLEKPWLPKLLRGLAGLAALSFLLGCFGPASIVPLAWAFFIATTLFAPYPTYVYLEQQGYTSGYGILGALLLPFLVPALVTLLPKVRKPLSRYWKCPHCNTVLVKPEDSGALMGYVSVVAGFATCGSCQTSVSRNEVYAGLYDVEER